MMVTIKMVLSPVFYCLVFYQERRNGAMGFFSFVIVLDDYLGILSVLHVQGEC